MLTERPEFSDELDSISDDETNVPLGRAPPHTHHVQTSELSVLSAVDDDPSLVDASAAELPPEGEDLFDGPGAEIDEDYREARTEVMRLVRTGDEDAPPSASPPVVRKWKAGEPPPAPRPRAPSGVFAEMPATDAAPPPARARRSETSGPLDPQTAAPPTPERGAKGLAAPPRADPTRVEAMPPVGRPPVDVEAIREHVASAEAMLRSAKLQIQRLESDGTRGINAQLAAAQQRLADALALLKG